MNRFYERFINSFCHIHRSSGWQPRLQLKLKLKPKLRPRLHLKVLLPLKPQRTPTPSGDPPLLTPRPHPPAAP